MKSVECWRLTARVCDAIALPGALLWAVHCLPSSSSLTIWLATGLLGVWLTRRVLRAVNGDGAYRFSMLSIGAAGLAAFNFVWTANALHRWLW